MARPIRVGITHGDINGIGYEVILKALSNETMTELCTPVIFGYHFIAEKCRRQLGIEDMRLNKARTASAAQPGRINVVDVGETVPEVTPGAPSPESGAAAVAALTAAVEALRAGDIDVLVTAPISKEAVQGDSFSFPGHTEFLESAVGGGAKALMILFDDYVKVALVTTHLPVSKISESITPERVEQTVKALDASLRQDFGIERPCIAVLSLNPHAGDGGLLGTEEKEVISPVVTALRENGMLVFGPYAADGFFGMGDYRKFDGVVAMYHDQGLAPFKTLAGVHGVNYTAGLPFVRTSPDHGTAFDMAWKGIADETSMREAIYKAIDIYRRRLIFESASANPLKKYVNERPDKGERQDRGFRREKPAQKDKDEVAAKESNDNSAAVTDGDGDGLTFSAEE